MNTGNTKPQRPRTLTSRRAVQRIEKSIPTPVHHPVLTDERDETPSDKEERDELSRQFMVENMPPQARLVKEINNEGPKRMIDAISVDNSDEVKALLQGPGGPLLLKQRLDKQGRTALHLAAQIGRQAIVELLLKSKADVDALDKNGATPLLVAAQDGHLNVVKCLLENKTEVNQADKDGYTPLYIAAQKGHLEVVKWLLANGADINQANKNDFTPLHIAAQMGHLYVVQCLLENKANVNKADKDGYMPLYVAAKMGHLDVVQCLLENKANVNKADKDGYTPLLIAAQMGHLNVVKCLLKNGVNVDQADNDGFTLLHVAADQGHKKMVQWLSQQAIAASKGDEKYMTKRQADVLCTLVNQQNKWKLTPLGIAAENGFADIAEKLQKLKGNALPVFATPVSPSPPQIQVAPCSEGLLIIGPRHLAYQRYDFLKELKGIAKKGNVALTVCGDGANVEAWQPITRSMVNLGAFAIVHCHGRKQGATHTLKFGLDERISTTQAVFELYKKGVRDITLYGCDIDAAVKLLINRIHLDPDWPKPLDKTLRIRFVGEDSTAIANNMADIKNQMTDFADVNERKKPTEEEWRMEKKTSSTIHTLTVKQGDIVMTRREPSNIAEQGLSEEDARAASGVSLLKHAMQGNLKALEQMREEDLNLKKAGKFSPFDINYSAEANGSTALYNAVYKGHVNVVSWLLQNGAKIDESDKKGYAPLYLAARRGHLDVVKCLLVKGAKVDKPNSQGITPLQIAKQQGHVKVVDMLLSHGAKKK